MASKTLAGCSASEVNQRKETRMLVQLGKFCAALRHCLRLCQMLF